jgi:hypothetical protein
MNQRIPSLFVVLTACAVAASAARATSAGAQNTPAPNLQARLDEWRGAHGSSWRLETDAETGHLKMLYGGSVKTSAHPRTDADFLPLANAAREQTVAMHGIDADTLVVDRAEFLPLGIVGSGDKETVRLREVVDGVRVVDGYMNFLFSADGALLSVQSTGLPHLSGFSTTPRIPAADAAAHAARAFEAMTGAAPTSVSDLELVIDQHLENGRRAPRLAYQVNAMWEQDGVEPQGFTYWIDALSGGVLRSEKSIHNFDVSGTVSAFASPGAKPDEASNPAAAQPMPYLKVTSSAGTKFTDANGNFNYPGVNAPLACTFQFTGGSRANVMNSAGAEYTLTQTLQPNQSNTVTMNSPAATDVTAQANAMRVVAKTSDYIHSITPGDTHADFSALANVNISQTCNANWNGNSINFFHAGGGCVNTAYATVVSHELGHWMNQLYGTGNGSDGMGEGNADVWALYIWNTPINGQDFSGPNSFVRTGNNLRQFCGDANPGCYGEVHNDGEVWMGAAWKVRANLQNAFGQVPGSMIADHLFLGWMNGYNQTQIKSIIETQWLTLDDDDANISNGTPHYTQIDAAFRTQGFPGVNVVCPTPSNFCVAAPNSFSPSGAPISSLGSQSVSTNNFTLFAASVPPDKTGLFFYGQNAVSPVPFGNGFRCIGNPFFRLPATTANTFGDLSYTMDMTALPPGGQISYAQTWNFQAWYRDPAAGGANYNSSDALSVTFCP